MIERQVIIKVKCTSYKTLDFKYIKQSMHKLIIVVFSKDPFKTLIVLTKIF